MDRPRIMRPHRPPTVVPAGIAVGLLAVGVAVAAVVSGGERRSPGGGSSFRAGSGAVTTVTAVSTIKGGPPNVPRLSRYGFGVPLQAPWHVRAFRSRLLGGRGFEASTVALGALGRAPVGRLRPGDAYVRLVDSGASTSPGGPASASIPALGAGLFHALPRARDRTTAWMLVLRFHRGVEAFRLTVVVGGPPSHRARATVDDFFGGVTIPALPPPTRSGRLPIPVFAAPISSLAPSTLALPPRALDTLVGTGGRRSVLVDVGGPGGGRRRYALAFGDGSVCALLVRRARAILAHRCGPAAQLRRRHFVDLSVGGAGRRTTSGRTTLFAGLADDRVAIMRLTLVGGATVSAPVVDNVYEVVRSRIPPGRRSSIAAIGRDRTVLAVAR